MLLVRAARNRAITKSADEHRQFSIVTEEELWMVFVEVVDDDRGVVCALDTLDLSYERCGVVVVHDEIRRQLPRAFLG